MTDKTLNRSQRYEEAENAGSNTSGNPTMGEIIAERFSRRDLLRGALAVTAISATVSPLALATAEKAQAQNGRPAFNFKEIAAGSDETHHVAEGYDADVLIRWGDPVLADAPAFDPAKQTAAAQRHQFGYNNDFVGFIPLDGSSEHGLLVVNHEYTNEELMFPGIGRQDTKDAGFARMTRDLVDIEMAAHGGSILEVRRIAGKWQVVKGSKYARRITADTEMEITGPAAGHERMKTPSDPSGRKVLGMLNNCAGGVTPWGTWLTCEENFNGYFWGKADGHPEAAALKRYGVPGNWYNWGQYHDRFDVTKEPNESNRFGWVVEIDPFDPNSVPKKRTALGRFKHEGAANIISRDGRFVIYQGDDERFDYVYKFVTEAKVDLQNRAANRDILDRGTLYVAKYKADGTGEWLPLVHGQGPLTEANGFRSQADVVIEARRAADLLGATKMDRPEDVEANPKTDKVYVMLTNNTRRKNDQVDAANPRADNAFGHIIEMLPNGRDHAATTFTWEILVKCGDPSIAAVGATFSSATTKDGWFGMPDNCAVDNAGRLWIATDGNSPKATGRGDGLWALETEGEGRGTSRHFFRVPAGAEMCGPCFTPDDETLFLAVQHPGESEDDKVAATFEQPSTRWPDFKEGMPPRPAIVVVTRRGGGKIGA
ncbi:PhoX family phosphatase [Chelatococcus sp. SYSU_G07232]|uniref:PhoX family phosphatase n=1 Tax=Chelatococcus albus TaxID=3047466 RepID=A0ABT7ADN5_9HYPH|nr:PhoX family phosphatase [Chelatococcus sp. SYSU_G07232]MDJ1156731.1 PhoX family phosphatase [Chelatococcus sp. SYSU_G07232]